MSIERASILLRIPVSLKLLLKEKADKNERTLNAEITTALKKHVQDTYRI
jgi:hypothetical protein